MLSNALTIIVEMPKSLLLERVRSAYHLVTIQQFVDRNKRDGKF